MTSVMTPVGIGDGMERGRLDGGLRLAADQAVRFSWLAAVRRNAGGRGGELFIGGQVTAGIGTPITLSPQDRNIAAAITSATEFAGRATSASDVRTNDRVSAQISGYGTALNVSDQAGMP
jgi:hypothetical protein